MILTSKLCVHDDLRKAPNESEERAGWETVMLPSTMLSLSVLWPSDIIGKKEIDNNNAESSESLVLWTTVGHSLIHDINVPIEILT